MLGRVKQHLKTRVTVGGQSFCDNRRHVSSDLWEHEGVVSLLCGDDVLLVVILRCEDHQSRVWILVHIDTNDYVVLQRWYLNPHFPSDCLWTRHGHDRCAHVQGQTSTYTLERHTSATQTSCTCFPMLFPDCKRQVFVSVSFLSC